MKNDRIPPNPHPVKPPPNLPPPMSTDKQDIDNELAMAILNGLSGPNACKAADERRRMIPLHIADQAVAACEKEISFLKAEVERLRASSFVTAVPVEQYERVIKAGDAMAQAFVDCLVSQKRFPSDSPSLKRWNAAKEGKPSV